MGNEIAKKYDFPQVHNASAGHSQLWKIYPGISKETKQEISLWIIQKDELSKRKPFPITDKPTLEQLFQIIRKDISTTKELNHGGILRIFEVFEENRNSFAFASERVVCSLADLLNKFEGIPGGSSWHKSHVDEKGSIMEVEISRGILNIAEGLMFLHNVQRRLHLNVSPENIVITPGGQWKICGFGFSLAFQNEEYQIASPYFFNTNNNNKAIRLEPDLNYVSPEMTLGNSNTMTVRYVTTLSDFFSLGMTAYEAYRYNLKYVKDGKSNSTILQIADGNTAIHQSKMTNLLTNLDLTCLPSGVAQLVLGMLQITPSSRISPNDVVNNAYFHSGPLAVLRALDTLHTRDLGSQASQLTGLPQQLAFFPPRILEATILPAVGRVCVLQNSLWVYALPLHEYISERIPLASYQTIASPFIIEGLAVTHPPETMMSFIKHLKLLQDKFDNDFFKLYVVKMICNSIDKAHPSLQVSALASLTETRVSSAIDRQLLEKEVIPRVCREACKNQDTAVKVKALYIMSLLCKRLPPAYLIQNFLPSLKYIAENYKSPAITMCLLGVYEALADLVGPEAIATSILPIISPMMCDRTLTRQQFELVSQRMENMVDKVLDHRCRELGLPLPRVRNIKTTSGSTISTTGTTGEDTSNTINGQTPLQPTKYTLSAQSNNTIEASTSSLPKTATTTTTKTVSQNTTMKQPVPTTSSKASSDSQSTSFTSWLSSKTNINALSSASISIPSAIDTPSSTDTLTPLPPPPPVPSTSSSTSSLSTGSQSFPLPNTDFTATFNQPLSQALPLSSNTISLPSSSTNPKLNTIPKISPISPPSVIPPLPPPPLQQQQQQPSQLYSNTSYPNTLGSNPNNFNANYQQHPSNLQTTSSLEQQILETQRQIQMLSGALGPQSNSYGGSGIQGTQFTGMTGYDNNNHQSQFLNTSYPQQYQQQQLQQQSMYNTSMMIPPTIQASGVGGVAGNAGYAMTLPSTFQQNPQQQQQQNYSGQNWIPQQSSQQPPPNTKQSPSQDPFDFLS